MFPRHGPKGNPHNRFGKQVSTGAKSSRGLKGKRKSLFGKTVSAAAKKRR